jgi:hypothetical protein
MCVALSLYALPVKHDKKAKQVSDSRGPDWLGLKEILVTVSTVYVTATYKYIIPVW